MLTMHQPPMHAPTHLQHHTAHAPHVQQSLLSSLAAWDAWLAASTAGYFARLCAGFCIVSVLSSLWVFFVAARLPPGRARLAACAPVVLLQMAATPLLVDRLRTPVLIVPVCGTLSLAAFKVAAYGMGRGPLAVQGQAHARSSSSGGLSPSHLKGAAAAGPGLAATSWADNLLQFGVVLSLPIIPRDAFKLGSGASVDDIASQPPGTWATFGRLYAAKAGGAAVAGSLAVWPVLPELLRHWFYALCLSLTLGALWDFWCLVAVVCAGIPVAPSFDAPWLSTSFADYWSRRWNLTTAYLLRVLIYEPVREGRLVPASASQDPAGLAGRRPASRPSVPQVGAAANREAALPSSSEDGSTGIRTAAPRVKVPVPQAAAAAPAGPDEDQEQQQQPGCMACTGGDASPSSSMLPLLSGDKGSGVCLAAATGLSASGPVSSHSSTSSCSSLDSDSTQPAPLRRRTQAAAAPEDGVASGGSAGDGADSAAAAGAGKVAPETDRGSRGKAVAANTLLRRAAALHATFLFSGLWHMLIFYYATGLVTAHWLAFFSVQGPVMVAEAALKALAKERGWPALPRPVAVLLTNFLLIVIARPLFFGPCDWSGLCSAMMDNVRGGMR